MVMMTASRPAAPGLAALHERLRAVLRRVPAHRAMPLVVSASVLIPTRDPLDLYARAGALAHDRLYWERPADGVAVSGMGAAWTIETAAIAAAGRAWQTLLRAAVIDDDITGPPGAWCGPLLLGGFAFDPRRPTTELWRGYPAGRLVLPRLALATVRGATVLTANLLLPPAADATNEVAGLFTWADDILAMPVQRAPDAVDGGRRGGQEGDAPVADALPRDEWEALVAAGAGACRDGRLEKVVLARAVEVRTEDHAALDATGALRRLRVEYPNAYVFAVARGARTFLGATPERLVRLHAGVAEVACLAGSAPRGESAEEDQWIGQALLGSAKDRREHAVVVRAVEAGLVGLCAELTVPAEPRLLRLSNVQHLYTPVTGRVSAGTGVLDLVERLHPTPAVGGQPRADALRFIRAHEGLDRGWYAAPVGWLDRHGAGEFAVALRSALLDGARATLFAGCGIVADSSPADEYAETCLKLRPMLGALGAR